jgi:hypothetical protein
MVQGRWISTVLTGTLALAGVGQAVAQTSPAGVVTAVHGAVTVARASLAEPGPLRFKDRVFVRDRIATGDHSLARLLLGGKALVTARERSIFTVTAAPGQATIEAASGKLALAVAKSLNPNGEAIEIRTRNAVVAVRGTVVVAEFRPGAALDGGQDVTVFTVLRGFVEVHGLNPLTGQAIGAPFRLGALQAVTLAGANPPKHVTISPAQARRVADEFTTPLAHVGGARAPVASLLGTGSHSSSSSGPSPSSGSSGSSGPSGSSSPSLTSGPSGSSSPSLTSGPSGSSSPSLTSGPSGSSTNGPAKLRSRRGSKL